MLLLSLRWVNATSATASTAVAISWAATRQSGITVTVTAMAATLFYTLTNKSDTRCDKSVGVLLSVLLASIAGCSGCFDREFMFVTVASSRAGDGGGDS